MTSSSRTSISSLPARPRVPPRAFALDAAVVSAYLRATGDAADYGECVPPLAAVALGLNALQEHISLPEGSLHTGQEVEHQGAMPRRR